MRARFYLSVAIATACVTAAPSPALAQSAGKATRFTIGVSGGVQQAAEDVSDHFTLPKNVETEVIDVKYSMKPWALIDLAAGYRLWKTLGVGVAVSVTSGKGETDVTASVPHPFFFSQPRTVTGTETDIAHSETGVHLQLQYLVPATGRLHFTLQGGPSWLSVDHDVVTDVTIAESYPYDTAAFGGAVTKSTKGSATGFNAGIDVTWLFAESLGIGGIVRYTRADVDLKAVEGRTLTMKAGGLQGGVGIRVLF
jgi:outer membrane protein with beta-barrel domain